MVLTVLIIFSVVLVNVSAQAYEDKRCRCICPSPATVFNNSQSKDRNIFTDYVPPNKCNCYGVILPKMSAEVNARAQEFCHRCECKYETRNTTIIMTPTICPLSPVQKGLRKLNEPLRDSVALVTFSEVEDIIKKLRPRKAPGPDGITNKVVVIIVLWVLTLLSVYLIFYLCLNPLNKRKTHLKSYMENDTEEARDLLAIEDIDE